MSNAISTKKMTVNLAIRRPELGRGGDLMRCGGGRFTTIWIWQLRPIPPGDSLLPRDLGPCGFFKPTRVFQPFGVTNAFDNLMKSRPLRSRKNSPAYKMLHLISGTS